MTLNLLPLYVACVAMIGLLSGFAHHNRRVGWVKKRTSLFGDLLELQAFAADLDGPAASEPAQGRDVRANEAPSLEEAAQFSSQLAGLNAGLKTSVKIETPELMTQERVTEAEHVSA